MSDRCPACVAKLPLASGEHMLVQPECGYLSPAALKARDERFSHMHEDWAEEQRIAEAKIGERAKPWRL